MKIVRTRLSKEKCAVEAVIKNILRKALAAVVIVAFFFLEGQNGYAVWLPVVVAALAAFSAEVLSMNKFLLAGAYMVIAFVTFLYLGSGIWGMAGVFAFPLVYEVLMGLVKLLDGAPTPTTAAK